MMKRRAIWQPIALVTAIFGGMATLFAVNDVLDGTWFMTWLGVFIVLRLCGDEVRAYEHHLTNVRMTAWDSLPREERSQKWYRERQSRDYLKVRIGISIVIMAVLALVALPFFIELPSNSSGKALATIQDGRVVYHKWGVIDYPFDDQEVINTSDPLICFHEHIRMPATSNGQLGTVQVSFSAEVEDPDLYYVWLAKNDSSAGQICKGVVQKIYSALVSDSQMGILLDANLLLQDNYRLPSAEATISKSVDDDIAVIGAKVTELRANFMVDELY